MNELMSLEVSDAQEQPETKRDECTSFSDETRMPQWRSKVNSSKISVQVALFATCDYDGRWFDPRPIRFLKTLMHDRNSLKFIGQMKLSHFLNLIIVAIEFYITGIRFRSWAKFKHFILNQSQKLGKRYGNWTLYLIRIFIVIPVSTRLPNNYL